MRKQKAILTAAAIIGAMAPCAGVLGDSVVLKSGDQFSGTITRIDATTVDVKTPFAGLIHVKRDTIKSLRSEDKVTVVAEDGTEHQSFVGQTQDGTSWKESPVVVAPPPPPAVLTPPTPVIPAKVYALNLEPYWLPVGPHWKDQFSLGLVNTTGNTESTSFAAELQLNYKDKPHELNLKLGGVYDVTNGSQTAGQAYFDAVYRRELPEWDKSERWYLFAENHELYDAIKEISYRITNGVGLGYYVFKDDKFTLDLRAGPAFVCEKDFSGDTSSDISGLVGLRAVYVINERASLSEEALYTFAFADFDRYQLTSETALNIKLPELARGMGMKLSFRDDYDNTAAVGKDRNDTRFVLSLTLDF
jgi:putative salt-induced outer membrane protein YdiY